MVTVTASSDSDQEYGATPVDRLRSALADDDHGFHVLRNFYTRAEVDAYRNHCERFLRNGKVIYTRINTDSMIDYVHPRSHDRNARTYRIYQFFHNHRTDDIGRFLRKAITLRDQIEQPWIANPLYRAERDRLQDYCVVTHYLENVGVLPIHRDYTGPAPHPLIQFWVALSQPGVDYLQGNLILHTRSGKKYRVEDDLEINAGDALLFDKSLLHEVEATKTGDGKSHGRWTAVIGARAQRDGRLRAIRRRVVYDARVLPTIIAAKRIIQQFRGQPPKRC